VVDFGAVSLKVVDFENESDFLKECNVVKKEYQSQASKSLLLPGAAPKKTISQLSIVKKKFNHNFQNNLFKIDEDEEEELTAKDKRELPFNAP